MFPIGWYPLLLGLGATSVLTAWSDLKTGYMKLWEWYPAFAGVAWFYYGLSFEGVLTGLLLALVSVPVAWTTLKFFDWRRRKQSTKEGREAEPSMLSTKGDYLAMAVYAFWPFAWTYVVTGAVILAYLGAQAKWWNVGRRGAPLAGLMGICFLGYVLAAAMT